MNKEELATIGEDYKIRGLTFKISVIEEVLETELLTLSCIQLEEVI